jgi:serine/threonine-protein kinase
MGTSSQGSQPTVLKHYALQRQLGRGAMGSVWAGQDRRDGSTVAVKLLHPQLGVDPEFRARFEREAHVAALLRSPYTVHLVDYGVADDTCYLVMEYVDGHTAADEMKQGPVDPARALRIATEIARALEEAGARGVVHRDIKPENVMIDKDDRVKVTDFGIARQSASAGMTSTGIFVGTPAYAAPEQVTGDVDHRSDLYALGATLFAMLTGRPPYRGNSVIQILEQHRTASLPMNELGHLPDPVVNVVRRCLEKDPRDRYQSATELVGALERASLNYASWKQGGGVAPATGAYDGGRSRPSTLPVTPQTTPRPPAQPPAPAPSRPSPVASNIATRLEPPPSRPGAPPAQPGMPAPAPAPSTISVTLQEKSAPGRDATGRYTLTLVNNGGAVARLRLVPTDSSGILQVNAPGRAAVPPGTTVLLEVTAQPRVRRARGPDRRLGFGVTAVDEANGATVGAATAEFADIVEGGGVNGKIVTIVCAAAVLAIGGGLMAFLLLGSGGQDEDPEGDETPSGSSTVDTRRAIAPGEYSIPVTVKENTCDVGPLPRQAFTLTYLFEPVRGDDLREGEQVNITGINGAGDEVPLGRAELSLDAFIFDYPVNSEPGSGTAEIGITFNEDGSIASAIYAETYPFGDATCEVVATTG